MGLSEAAVKSAIHRLRQRFAELVRAEVAHTVASSEEAEEELRYLVSVLNG
jgi:RNA polymerase sigma-70 factor (ECF subfamily)